MRIIKELSFYFILVLAVLVMSGFWNVSNAQEVMVEDVSDTDIELLRNKLLADIEMEDNLSDYEDTKDKEFNEMVNIYEEEERKREAELRAKIEAEIKAKKEAEMKAKKEAEIKAKKEAELKAEKEVKKSKQVGKVSDSSESNNGSGKVLNVTTTAYTAGCNGCSGFTASGYDVRNTIYYNGMRVIAADTSILPIGTIVEVSGIGKAVVLDRGGAIKGNKIDILFGSKSEAYSYGRKHNIQVRVIGKI